MNNTLAGTLGIKLGDREAELYKRCDEVLYYIWDPIGIAREPSARDEYYQYLPDIFDLVRSNANSLVIENRLSEIALSEMGVAVSQERNHAAATILLNWRNHILGDAA